MTNFTPSLHCVTPVPAAVAWTPQLIQLTLLPELSNLHVLHGTTRMPSGVQS